MGLALEPGTVGTVSPPRTRWCRRGPPRTPRAGARPRKPGLATSRDHQGPPAGVPGGPCPASERLRPGTTSGDPRGPPGPAPGPQNRAFAPLRPAREHQGAPGTTSGGPCPASEHRRPGTTSGDPPAPPGAPQGPECPPLSTPPAGALGLRPAPQAPRGPGAILDFETFSQRPRDLGDLGTLKKSRRGARRTGQGAGPLRAPRLPGPLSGPLRESLSLSLAPGAAATLQKKV